jgi:hypothetical protein
MVRKTSFTFFVKIQVFRVRPPSLEVRFVSNLMRAGGEEVCLRFEGSGGWRGIREGHSAEDAIPLTLQFDCKPSEYIATMILKIDGDKRFSKSPRVLVSRVTIANRLMHMSLLLPSCLYSYSISSRLPG